MSRNNGGLAFPAVTNDGLLGEKTRYPGMTLKQYYAGLALNGLLSNRDFNNKTPEEIASDANYYATALIGEVGVK